MPVDTITIGKDGTSTGFSAYKALADRVEKLAHRGDLSIDASTGKMLVMGMGKDKHPVKITAQGMIECKHVPCTINDRSFKPSIAFMNAAKTTRDVLNDYILAFEDYKINPSSWNPMMINNVQQVSIKPSGDRIGIIFNNDREMDVNKFLLDPSIISKISIKNDDIGIKLNNITCGVISRGIDKNKIMLCSKNAGKEDAIILKETLVINDEQAATARKISFHEKSKRLRLGFDHAPRCYIIHGTMCCKYRDDPDNDAECY